MFSEKVRWGVISTANIGREAVIPALLASPKAEVRAVASRDAEKAAAFCAQFEIPQAYASYQELLDDPQIEAVYIPLPNSLHKEWVLKAAEAGKHILCEKPLGLNSRECLEMDEAARRQGVKLMEAFMYRFHPRIEKLIQLTRSGQIGRLRNVEASFTFRVRNQENIRLRPDLGGGSLMDVGCYCVNVIRTLAAEQPESVCAYANWASTGVDAQMAGLLRFENGVLGHFDCSLIMERREVCTIAGEDAYFKVENTFLPGKGETKIEEIRGRETGKGYSFNGVDEYQLMVEHFCDCIRLDRQPRYSAAEAAENMQVIEALYRSARNKGRAETVETA